MEGPEVTEETLEPGVVAIRVRGELDLGTIEAFESSVTGAVDRSVPVFIDLTGCGFIDSSVLALLIDVHGRLGDPGNGRFAIAAHDQPLKVLRLTGLDDRLPVYPSADEALSALRGAPGD